MPVTYVLREREADLAVGAVDVGGAQVSHTQHRLLTLVHRLAAGQGQAGVDIEYGAAPMVTLTWAVAVLLLPSVTV